MSLLGPDRGKYVWIWEKYRPMLLNLMTSSAEGNPKDYKLSKHEFLDTNNKRPSGYAFKMRVYQGRSETDIKKSLTAQDLLAVLNHSNTAKDLLSENLFEFTLDKHFVLQVSRESRAE